MKLSRWDYSNALTKQLEAVLYGLWLKVPYWAQLGCFLSKIEHHCLTGGSETVPWSHASFAAIAAVAAHTDIFIDRSYGQHSAAQGVGISTGLGPESRHR